MTTATPTTFTATETLAILRDDTLDADDVAKRLGCSPYFAAGAIDAVTGTGEFLAIIDWCEEDEAAREEYRAGFFHGEMLVEEEAAAEGYAEAYAVACAEAAAPECLPPCASDIPW